MNRSIDDELPLVEPLASGWTAVDVWRRLLGRPHLLFLDSAAGREEELGRYSFVMADPFAWLEVPADGTAGLDQLEQAMRGSHSTRRAGLPPFQGGAAGLFGYELGRSLETIPKPVWDEFQLPALAVGLYDVVFAFDHSQGQGWLISQGHPAANDSARRQRAGERLAAAAAWLHHQATPPRGGGTPIAQKDLAPQFATQGPTGLTSNFSAEQYVAAVARVVDYIHAGDVFQVNLSQRLLYPARESPAALYERLRERNAAPFAGYLDLGDATVLSASPERFIRVDGQDVETRPIKGTRGRFVPPEADLFAGDDLRQSAKDRAENIMIVDLMRNDLSRVCEDASIQATELCKLETYATVQHLVSTVRGRLAADRTVIDLLRACFPGGSITGAPKIRAMEIIREIEPTARGPYCGSLGYIGFDGDMDTNILIRTITAAGGWWQFPVGGGIVAQSDPRDEYEETWHKAEGMLRAIQ